MKQSRVRVLALAGLLGLTFDAQAGDASSIPLLGSLDFRPTPERPFGWRGDGSGRFPGATPVTEWSSTKNVRWSAVVGQGYSSPILTEKFVFVASEPNLVVCLRRSDGVQEWKLALTPDTITDPKSRSIAERYQPPKDGSGMSAATPVTDGQSVFVVLANGMVCAVDLDGKLKWVACIEAEQNTAYGRSASPLLVAGKLIVHMSNLYAFEPATGKRLWINEEVPSSYGTPVALKVGNVDLIVTPRGDVVRAVDGVSVNSAIGRASQSSPIACGDGVVCFGENEVSLVRLNASFKEEGLWSATVTGDVFGSPILHGDTLFIANGDGELLEFDKGGKGAQEPLVSGRPLFKEGGSSGPAAYGSLTIAGKHLFLTSNSGETVVFDSDRKAGIVHRNQLPAGTGSNPIFSGNDMFQRDGDKLWCIGR